MLAFDYAKGTIATIDLRDEIADARHRAIMAPIIIRHYSGRSYAGCCTMSDHDAAHARYLRAWRRQVQANDNGTCSGIHANGYLP